MSSAFKTFLPNKAGNLCGVLRLSAFKFYKSKSNLNEVMIMTNEQWMPMPMYCPNCGNLNYGYQNNEGKIKYECTKCRIVFIRIKKGRRHDTIDLYAPKEQERLAY